MFVGCCVCGDVVHFLRYVSLLIMFDMVVVLIGFDKFVMIVWLLDDFVFLFLFV